MLNTRFFDEFDEFRRSFEQLFDNTGWQPASGTSRTNGQDWHFAPAVETGWTDDYLNLRFVLPAVHEKDVEVTVQGNQLIIRGERRAPEGFGKEGSTYYRLPYGKFERAVDLPNGLNSEKLQAHLHDGVLDVRIPVAETMKSRKIQIESGAPAKSIAA